MHPEVLETISNELCDWGHSARGLPAEGAMTSVELARRRFGWLMCTWVCCCEIMKARASSRDVAIADIIVNVFPRPMSSASIPPRGESGFADFLDPRIVC